MRASSPELEALIWLHRGWVGRIFSLVKEIHSAVASLNITGPKPNIMTTSSNYRQLNFWEKSTSSQEASPANHLASPDKEKAFKMNAISSRKLVELLKRQNRAGLFLKTLLDCSPFWNPIVYLRWRSKRLSFFVRTISNQRIKQSSDCNDGLSAVLFEKLEKQDMYFPNLPMARQSFCVFRLLPSERHTSGTAFGLLPTPTAIARSNLGRTLIKLEGKKKLNHRSKKSGEQVSLTDFLIYHSLMRLSDLVKHQNVTHPMQVRFLKMLPTKEQTFGTKFPRGNSGLVCPRFLAELMGFPVNWTEYPFLSGTKKAQEHMEMPSFPK